MTNVFHTKIHLAAGTASLLTIACCILHNMLRELSPNSYTPANYVDQVTPNGDINEGEWRREKSSQYLSDLRPTTSRYYLLIAGRGNKG